MRIQKIFQKSYKYNQIPKVDKPITFAMPIPKIYTRQSNSGLFSGLVDSIKNGIETAVNNVKNVADNVANKIIDAKTQAESVISTAVKSIDSSITYSEEVIAKRNEFNQLLNKYKDLGGSDLQLFQLNGMDLFILSKLRAKILELKDEIAYREMVIDLKPKFRKGYEHYFPRTSAPVKAGSLENIAPDSKLSFKENLQRMSAIYLRNTQIVDTGLDNFHNLSRNFFSEASQSIKEIFALQSDSTTKWLERIPKLGIIPKALRVSDQIKLTNCVVDDYKDITKMYLDKGLVPFMNKYNRQFETIKNYIDNNKLKALYYRKYTKSLLRTIEEIKKQRMETNAKLIKAYAQNGLNIENICTNVKKKGSIELATKTLFTLIPFC